MLDTTAGAILATQGTFSSLTSCCQFIMMKKYLLMVILLAHLSQRLIGEPIVYPYSGVRGRRCCRHCCCLQPFSNIFSSETAWPIKAKFYVEPPWEGGTKVCKWSRSHDQDGCHAHIW